MGPLGQANPGPTAQPQSSPTGSSFGPSDLVGAGGQDQGQPGNSPDAQSNALSSVVEMVRGMETSIQGLVQQYPVVAPEARAALQAIRGLLQRVISSPTEDTEPASPMSLA